MASAAGVSASLVLCPPLLPSASADSTVPGVTALAVTVTGATADARAAAESTSSITAVWQSTSVPVSENAVVDGTVAPAGRSVNLEIYWSGAWTNLATTNGDSSSGGAYSFQFTSDTAYVYDVRLHAPATDTAPEVTSPVTTITFTEPVAPEPSPTASPTATPTPSPTPEPKKATTVSITASASKVRVHNDVYLTGKVTGGVRGIEVVEKLPSGWRVMAIGKTSSTGGYKIKAPTGWYKAHVYAVQAPATSTYAAARSAARTVTVVPGYTPPGSARSYSWISPGERWRFDPCQTLTYRVNPARGGKGAIRDVKGAFTRLTEATGIRFRYLGTTTATPMANREGRRPADADIVISWQYRKHASKLGGAAGIGGPASAYGGARDAQGALSEVKYSDVLLAADLTGHLRGGFGTGPRYGWHGTRGQLLMHEISHALGAGHTNGQGQIMEPVMDNDPARFGAGDLTILSKIGMQSGCITRHAIG